MMPTTFDQKTELQAAAKKPAGKDKKEPESLSGGAPSSTGGGEKSKNQNGRKGETVTSILDRVDADFPYDLPI